MKIVTDTNVVVSGLLWLGTPGRLLEAAANGRITLYTSPALVNELRSTLSYGRLAPRIQRSGLTLDELIGRYLNVAILVQPSAVPRIVANDADDDQVLACALEARADLIVSGDRKHLLPLGSYQGIPIVNAAEALRSIEAKK
jgi:uncharacterized protein